MEAYEKILRIKIGIFRDALKKITALDPGLWKTAQRIAMEALDKEEINESRQKI